MCVLQLLSTKCRAVRLGVGADTRPRKFLLHKVYLPRTPRKCQDKCLNGNVRAYCLQVLFHLNYTDTKR